MQIPLAEEGPRLRNLRNAMAEGTGHKALRLRPVCADKLVTQLYPAAGDKILDVATGTGELALAASQAVGQGLFARGYKLRAT